MSATGYGYGYGAQPGGTTSFRTKIDALSTVRARLGFDLNGSTMIYATAGFATAHQRNEWSTTATDANSNSFTANSTRSGWNNGYVIGGGIEQKLTGNLTLKAEVDWIKLKSRGQASFPASSGYGLGVPGQVRFDNPELVIGRVGLNYRF